MAKPIPNPYITIDVAEAERGADFPHLYWLVVRHEGREKKMQTIIFLRFTWGATGDGGDRVLIKVPGIVN